MNIDRSIPESLTQLPSVMVVCGHYGVGKTNFSLNLAYDLAALGRKVTLVDLDIVNPYFRSSDHASALEAAGIELLCPQSAGTALDAPMLSVAIDAAIGRAQQGDATCIIDAGGDDVGATALGRFAKVVQAAPFAMLYVVNGLREQTLDAREAAALLPEMEATSHLRATHVVNNTHLMDATTPDVVARGITFAQEAAAQLDLPLLCTAIPLADRVYSMLRSGDATSCHFDSSPGHSRRSEESPQLQQEGSFAGAQDDKTTDFQGGVARGSLKDAEATAWDTISLQLEEQVNSGALACENPYFVRILVKKPWEV